MPDGLIALVEKRPNPACNPWLRRMMAASVLLICLAGTDYALDDRAWRAETVATADSREAMLDEIAAYHLVYARQTEHLAEVPAERREHIEAWLGSLLNRTLKVPDLSSQGLKFEGARLLAIDAYPVAQLPVAQTRRPGGYLRHLWRSGKQTARYRASPGAECRRRDENGYTYVVVGALTEDSVRRIAAKVDTDIGTWRNRGGDGSLP